MGERSSPILKKIIVGSEGADTISFVHSALFAGILFVGEHAANRFPEDTMQTLWKNIETNYDTYLRTAAGIAIIYIFASFLERVTARLIRASYKKRAQTLGPERQRRLGTASTILQSASKYVIWFLAIAGVVGQLGLTSTMGSMLTAAGIGGIALGIGAQSLVKDIVAGLFVVLEDQMAVGDYVKIADVTGTVEEITLRATVLRGFRGELSVIPNGSIGVLTNYSRADYLALVDVNVSYESDMRRAMACMREEAEAFARESGTAVDAPQVLGVTALGGAGITLRMVLRVQPMTHWAAERAMRARIRERFAKEGIEIPRQTLVSVGGEAT